MNDQSEAQAPAGFRVELQRAAYRAMILTPEGQVLRIEPLDASSDDEAVARAKAMMDGHAVELWDGLRFIEHFAHD